jgi:hypothetical protein
MNSLFTNGMSFYICDIDVLKDSDLFDLDMALETSALYNLNHVDDAINIYFANSLGANSGVARFPWHDDSNAVFVASSTNPNVLTHEIGHCFGLFHTHQCTMVNPSPINSTDPDCPGELVNGTNAHEAGDRMIDTDADPGQLNNFNPYQVGGCSTTNCDVSLLTCVFNATNLPLVDPNSEVYHPDIFNVMSYYSCEDYSFTPKQLELMEKVLLNDPSRNFSLTSNPNYCDALLADKGNIKRYCELIGGPPLLGQPLTVATSAGICVTKTKEDGEYQVSGFCNLGFVTGEDMDFTVVPKLYDPAIAYHDATLGVNVFDMVKIQQYILGLANTLDTPYKLIAADVNNDRFITAFDLVLIRQVILQYEVNFDIGNEGATWRFFPTYYLNSSPSFNTAFHSNPFTAIWQNLAGGNLSYSNYMDMLAGNLQNPLFSNNDNWSFRAIKIGDVDCSAVGFDGMLTPLVTSSIESREEGLSILPKDIDGCLKKGEKGEILFKLSNSEGLVAYEMGLNLDSDKLKVTNLKKGNYEDFDLDNFNQDDLFLGDVKTIWWSKTGKVNQFLDDKTIFSIEVEALEDICSLSDLIQADNEILNNNFFNLEGKNVASTLSMELKSDHLIANMGGGKLNVNVFPNPSNNKFTFEIEVENAAETTIIIYDRFGNSISQRLSLIKGKQNYTFNNISELANGLLYYTISTEDNSTNGKLIKVE